MASGGVDVQYNSRMKGAHNMTPERLAEIRVAHEQHVALYAERGWLERGAASGTGLMAERAELLTHVNELTRQLEDARNLAIRCGAFETWTGTDVETYVAR